jgi:glycosyltransferase involved in cell wall biosynthesis
MSNSYCIVIPHYRHFHPLSELLSKLTGFGLDTFVVDDGSGDDVLERLTAEIDRYDNIYLVARARNGGKGAAMITGFQHAVARGHSHVISLDADGQHNPDDVPKLLALSMEMPESLYSGRPIFGDDIPASRLYGRKLTNGLVQLLTGSKVLKDAMCGLRVYPLEQVLPLCEALGYRTRMEFDIEILVRACWAGMDVRVMDTQVIYPEDGESHFNLFRDNVRLVLMHTLLIVGGLARLPARLWRRFVHQVSNRDHASQ